VDVTAPQLDSGEFQVSRRDVGRVTVLTLSGELDMATTPLLREALDNLDGCPIVLDVANLTFVDSYGLHVIFSRAATHDVALARPHPHVARLLELTEGATLVPVHATLEAALEGAGS
jgi:anti-sigma B factor antagonist